MSNTSTAFKKILTPIAICTLLALSNCGDPEVPPVENPEELITDIILTFTADAGSSEVVIATATDPDQAGPADLAADGPVLLSPDRTYTLVIGLTNSVDGEAIDQEVLEEAHEHRFYFSWTQDLFTDPAGNGNTDEASDPVNYLDSDRDGLSLGLRTQWETGAVGTGTFRIVLKHQPGVKSSTSGVSDGETDLDLVWDLAIE